jgi:hypothetical protein
MECCQDVLSVRDAIQPTRPTQSVASLSTQLGFSGAAGYTILEALIATAMTSIVGAGLWQLAASTRTLVTRSFHASQPICDAPTCADRTRKIECQCGDQIYVIVR